MRGRVRTPKLSEMKQAFLREFLREVLLECDAPSHRFRFTRI
jgi:hypothetical protein